jgi:hypothetical protein
MSGAGLAAAALARASMIASSSVRLAFDHPAKGVHTAPGRGSAPVARRWFRKRPASFALLREIPNAGFPRCNADAKGENDRSLITSDTKTRPLNQAPAVRSSSS